MTDRFSLLRLPQDSLKSVLRSMEPLHLILFSFFSKRAKTLVTSINLKSKVTAEISNVFTIYVNVGEQQLEFEFYSNEIKYDGIPMKMGTPGIVNLFDGESKGYKVPKVMDIPCWFSHIKTIFNCPKIFQLEFFLDVGNFDLDSIKDTMIQENIHHLVVSTSIADEFNYEIMKTFGNMNHLYLDDDSYENGKPPGEVLIQNFCKCQVGYYSISSTTMKLDDILMMNSKVVLLLHSELTEKDANRFLKLWMRGKSKLEFFSLSFSKEIVVDRDTLLKGIKFQEVPLEVKRFFIGFEVPIEGGIDVIRRDGTRGTIKLEGRYMDFYIWHDYCKVEK